MNNKTPIGLVGCGKWGRYILRDLVGLGCDVHVVARTEASRARAREYGAASIVAHHDELPDVDGVVVAVPTANHGEITEGLLARRVPIFVEKPLTADVESARRIVRAAGERVFVMHKWRYHPGIEELARIASTEELGAVQGMTLTQVDWGNPHSDVDVAWILAPHCLSIALAVLGELPRPTSAVAKVHAEIGLQGLMAVLGHRPWVSMAVSARYPEKVREFRLFCEGGVAMLGEGYAKHIKITRGVAGESHQAPEPEWRPISQEMPLLRELEEFVTHVRGGPPPRCPASEGLAVVEGIAELRRLAGVA